MEHVRCGKQRLAIAVKLDVRSEDVAISAEDLLCLRIPYDQLLVRVFHSIELIDIHRQTASASRVSECLFAESADLHHDIRGVMVVDHVDLVMTFVCISQFLSWGKLSLEDIHINRCDDRFHR